MSLKDPKVINPKWKRSLEKPERERRKEKERKNEREKGRWEEGGEREKGKRERDVEAWLREVSTSCADLVAGAARA